MEGTAYVRVTLDELNLAVLLAGQHNTIFGSRRVAVIRRFISRAGLSHGLGAFEHAANANGATKFPDENICAMVSVRIPGPQTCDFVKGFQDQEVGGEGPAQISRPRA